MRKEAYIYKSLEKAIVDSGRRHNDILKALGMEAHTWISRRSGKTDWKLREMLDVRKLLPPNMTLDALFRREKVTHDGTV